MSHKANRDAVSAHEPLFPGPVDEKRAALGELFLRSQNRLYKTALRIVGNPEDADEDRAFDCWRRGGVVGRAGAGAGKPVRHGE